MSNSKTEMPGAEVDTKRAIAVREPLFPSDEEFNIALKEAAVARGCRYLFELPANMIDETADKIAAILCPDDGGRSIVFLCFHNSRQQVTVVEAGKVPQSVLEFCWSFVRVMDFLPASSTHLSH